MKPLKQDIAAALGVTPPYVTALIAKGMPLYSIAAAKAWYDQNIRSKTASAELFGDGKNARQQPSAGDGQGAQDGSQGLRHWRERLEAANAKRAELELQKLAGTLVYKSDYDRVMSSQLTGVKAQLDALPARAAAALGVDDAHRRKVLHWLRDELTQILSGVAKSVDVEAA